MSREAYACQLTRKAPVVADGQSKTRAHKTWRAPRDPKHENKEKKDIVGLYRRLDGLSVDFKHQNKESAAMIKTLMSAVEDLRGKMSKVEELEVHLSAQVGNLSNNS